MSKINSNSTLFLIDGSTFIFRAYFAMYKASQNRGSGFSRSDGLPTGAVMAFCNMMWKIISNGIENIHPSHIAVVFDTKEKTFRSDIYPSYKANRDAPPEDLIPQFPLIHRAVEAFNIKSISKSGFEADDIIATYSKQANEVGAKTIIISGDKDLMQLVNDNVVMYDPMPSRERFIDIEGVIDKFGVPPNKVVDVQSLAGDSTDNIPGVPGIGLKIAAELINEYETLENLLDNAESIKQTKRRENLISHANDARISYRLALLDSSTPLDLMLDDLSYQQLDHEKILSFSKEMEFSNLEKRIDSWFSNFDKNTNFNRSNSQIKKNNTSNIPPLTQHIEIRDPDTFDNVFNKLIESKEIFIDISSGDSGEISLTINGDIIYTIFLDKEKSEEKIEENNIFEKVKYILEDPSIKKIFFDYKSALYLLERYQLSVNVAEDLSLLAYVSNNGKIKNELTALATFYKNEISIFEELEKKIINKIELKNHERVYLIHKIWQHLTIKILSGGAIQVYELIEKPLIKILFDMENKGIKADKSVLDELSFKFGTKIKQLENKIYILSGQEFNIASPKQLGKILFDKLELKGGKKNKSGAWATGIDILEDLSLLGYEIADNIIEWRQLSKLKTTYTDSIPNFINKTTQRVHTQFSQSLTSTGRLSSSSPNLQNIPIRTYEGKQIRSAFVAVDDHVFLSADYSQIELRVLAHVAEIEQLRNTFLKDLDIHKMTAASIFNIEIEDVTEEMRYQAKSINFGIIYGISAFGLGKQLKIPRHDAKKFIDDYLLRFPGIKQYMDRTIDMAKTNEYTSTMFGRRCYFPDINSRNHAIRSFNERAAINAPIQGSAADIIKRAMIKIYDAIELEKLRSKMILQIHDELVFEVPIDEVEIMKSLVTENMENATKPLMNFSVPLKIDMSISNSWDQA
ncbi:MAG: DNA polymerase I [Rhodobiaceae bacterium]|nr:DNA polymerase I [Rhodobiaceae bacterium]RPF95502.1 MAG: DNA polymerase I [Rhizobiales bacterium TMED227]|tara:strand:- start:6772 stop:9516 length:2745 start_codon:yes stop_codon:yes gene_type:complete